MEALREILQWWQSLRAAARVLSLTVLAAVVAALGAATYQAYSVPAAQWSAVPDGSDLPAARASATSILSLPLPGTRRREQAEIAQRLESMLAGYDYVASADAIFATPLLEAKSADSPRLALSLHLEATSPRPDSWLDSLTALVLHTVQGLQRTDLLITDSSGALLFSQGQPTPAAARLLEPALVSAGAAPTAAILSDPWKAALGLTAVCVVLAMAAYLVLRWRTQYERQVEAPPTEISSASVERPNPLHFLAELSPDEVTALVGGERPEVVAVALQNMPDEEITRQGRSVLDIDASSLPTATHPARDETLRSLADALQLKRTASENNPCPEPTAAVFNTGSDGD